MPIFLSVGEAARHIRKRFPAANVLPQHITTLFYKQRLREDICPLIGGRRAIPADYLEMIEAELRRDGKLPRIPGGVAHA